MKLKYKNEILYFFIVFFSFVILYYGLGKLLNKRSIIEGVTNSDTNKASSSASKKEKSKDDGDSEIKTTIKNMNNFIKTNVDPKVSKFLEKLKNVTSEINAGVEKKIGSKLNEFGSKNDESTKYSSQDKVPPFSGSQINNVI
jgi:ribosomal protein S20